MNNLKHIPIGYSEALFKGKKYGVQRTDFNDGKSTKVYAEELGGSDFVSFNFYRTSNGHLLKPCEMLEKKVLKFLKEAELIHTNS